MKSDDDLPLSLAQKVEAVCVPFEAMWRTGTGTQPKIENFLVDLTDPVRLEVLRELILVDIHWRRTRGESCQAGDYQSRFPELAADWLMKALSDSAPTGLQMTRDNSSETIPDRISSFGDYKQLEIIARGGMGVVYKAIQTSLDRTVAIKMILASRLGSKPAAVVERFRQEAKSAACLNHPHIVPIYEVGEHEGQHFFSMKLIEGKSLAQTIGNWRAADMDGQRRAAELLATVARAVHHAHQRGILHCDLKPGNILIDADNQPHVTDFGLAKPVACDNGSMHTGAISGTPSYMAPEQARGDPILTTAIDVHAIGAILYELLTGQPPFKGKSFLETLRIVQERLATQPRVLQPMTDLNLEAICLKCLKKDPVERYGSAEALAEDLERWVAWRPVKARHAGKREQAWLWCKRQPAWAGFIAAAVLFLVASMAASFAGVFWYVEHVEAHADQERNLSLREAAAAKKKLLAEQAARNALEPAEKSRQDLQEVLTKPGGIFDLLNHPENWGIQISSAQASLVHATKILANEPDADRDLVERIDRLKGLLQEDEADRLLAVRLETIRMDKSNIDVRGVFDLRTAAEEYSKALSAWPLTEIKRDPVAIAEKFKASPIKEQLVASLDDWALIAFKLGDKDLTDRLLTIARLTTPDTVWGDRIRQSQFWSDLNALEGLAKDGPPAGMSPQMLDLVGQLLAKDKSLAETWLRMAQATYPADFWLNLNLGNALSSRRVAEKAGFFRVAVAVRPKSSAAYNNLGNNLRIQKMVPEAIAACEKAIELNPKHALPYGNLGACFIAQNEFPKAVAEFWKAIKLDPKCATAYSNLGLIHHRQGHLPEAIGFWEKAIELDPTDPVPHSNLGIALMAQKQMPTAIDEFRKAIKLDREYAPAYMHLGTAFHIQNKLAEAIEFHLKAIELDPTEPEAYFNLGNAFRKQDRFHESICAYEKAINLDAKHAGAYSNLSIALRKLNRLPEALVKCQKAIELDPKNAESFISLGLTLSEQSGDEKKLKEAIDAFLKAIELDETNATAHSGLAGVYLAQNNLPKAIAAFQKATRLGSMDPGTYVNFGVALNSQRKFADAASAFRKAIEIDPNNAVANNNLGNTLRSQKKLPAAIDALRRAIDLRPTYKEAHHNLGLALRDEKKLPEAISAFRIAIGIDSRFAPSRVGLGLALYDQGNFDQATDAFQQAIDMLPPRHTLRGFAESNFKQCQRMRALEKRLPSALVGKEPANADELLQLAMMCAQFKHRHVSAEYFYREAFRTRPALVDDWTKQHRYNAACAAALAGTGMGDEAGKLRAEEKAKLRERALGWLQADLGHIRKRLTDSKAEAIVQIEAVLLHWQQDADLTCIRDADGIDKLPAEEQKSWQKFWADAAKLLKETRDRIDESRMDATLTEKERNRVHKRKMIAGNVYVIEMESAAFDTFLKLEDPEGKLLAENDDISPDNLNSRIIFTPRADGVYRIIATSFQQQGTGPYLLRIREFKGSP